MPRFEPFRALRYAVPELAEVIAPPYDVLSETDVAALAERSEHNIVHVDVPRGGEDRYQRAAEVLEAWAADGVLVADEQPTLTIYRLRFVDATGAPRDIAGVLGGLEVVDEGAGGVLPHERTTPKASTDRLDLTRATGCNLSPVWGLSLAAGLTEALRQPGELLAKVVDAGVEHVVERIDDPSRIAAISDLLAGDDVLIADGHHRYGISRTYRDEVRAATGRHDTAAEQTLAFVSELIADQLSVEAIHRLYHDLAPDTLRAALAQSFDCEAMDTLSQDTLAAMQSEGFLVLIEPAEAGVKATKLTAMADAFDSVRSLDGAWLEAALPPEIAVSYQHGLAEVVEAVATRTASAAVLIRPVSVAEIERTAREGLLMPPKSTFFTPKLKTGFVIRPLR